MKKKPILGLIPVLFVTIFWSNALAQGSDVVATDTTTLSKVDARRFTGAWKIDGSNSVILIRLHGEDQLGVRGQDLASVWEARCIRKNNVLFDCVGTGEKFPNIPFLFHSTMRLVDDHLEDEWKVEGTNESGIRATRSGVDKFERIRARQ